jgi:xanthine dehydrogenase small subunit
MLSFILNNETIQTDMPHGMTVLDFVRYYKNLKGTKIGCREGDCGACTVLVGQIKDGEMVYRSMTSCLMPLVNAHFRHIVTIEGINPEQGALTPVQEAMVEENGTQCGFCTVGFVVSLTGFCLQHDNDTTDKAISAIDGNICRCTGYKSIERASGRIVNLLKSKDGLTPVAYAVAQGIVPPWFDGIKNRLDEIMRIGTTKQANVKVSSKPMIVSGGTDVYVQLDDIAHRSAENVFNRNDLKEIREVKGRIEIGGSVTVTDLLESGIMQEIFPRLYQHLKLVSSTPIRNMATIAGNLVNASPIGDLTIWFLALDSTIVLRNGSVREMQLRDFYQGYKSLAKTADEVVEKIYFKKPDANSLFNFEKVSKRTYLDIATVNTAILLSIKNGTISKAHVSAGGVAPVPLYLKNVSSYLMHRMWPFDKETMKEVNHILQAEISPISDVRGSARYKRLLLQRLFFAHFIELFEGS